MNWLSVIKWKSAHMITSYSGEMPMLLGICGFLMAIGVMMSADVSSYYGMLGFAHKYIWITMLLIYAGLKLYSVFFRTMKWLRVTAHALGLWVWNYIFLSFVVFNFNTFNPTELLLLIPIIVEIWSMVSMPAPNTWRRKRDTKNATY